MSASSTVRLPRTTPESQGIPSSALLNFVEAVEVQKLGLHSLMLVRRGHVVAEGWWEPYGPDYLHVLFSLSKSFASTAVGLAAAEGHLSLDDTVISFFPEDAPATISDNLRAMRVRDLLSMSCGHAEDSMGNLFGDQDGNWIRGFLAMPVLYTPGTHFVYDTGATYMLSAIVQKVTGQTLTDYLTPRLLEPLGIVGARWDNSPQGINIGGFGFNIKTEDIACFGQLYLQDGVWNGKRLLPEGWVAEATAKHINNVSENLDWAQGYGYQFWRCRPEGYRGDGAFGQFCIVLPEHETVVAITSGTQNMQAVLDAVWEHILPALGEETLPEDTAAHNRLSDKLSKLILPMPPGAATSGIAASVSGQTYHVAPNDLQISAIRCDFSDNGATIVLTDDIGEQSVVCGYRTWERGNVSLPYSVGRPTLMRRPRGEHRIAVSGAWSDEATYSVQLCLYETPFIHILDLRFDGDGVTLSSRVNVSFEPMEPIVFVGKREAVPSLTQ